MTEQNVAIRLKHLIEELGISNSQFADECNISRPILSQLITGRNKKVSDVILSQIHYTYPRLSISWLLFGEGEMWLDDKPDDNDGDFPDGDHIVVSSTSLSSEATVLNNDKVGVDGSIGKYACENPELPGMSRDNSEYPKERGLNNHTKPVELSNHEELNVYLKKAELLSDLAKIKDKTKKVVHVTIYYNDSTFETFYPGK